MSPRTVWQNMDLLRISRVIPQILEVISKANKYIDLSTPWLLIKEGKPQRLNQVLYNLVETIRIIAIALKPYMIETPDKIFSQICVSKEIQTWDSAKKFGLLENGTKIFKKDNLFPRIEIKKEKEKVESVENNNVTNNDIVKNKEENYITINELEKVELKVGQILEVERIEKADKLYKLTVDLGTEKRTIVSGLVKYYTPEQLLNKQVVVVANLKPVKLRGVESQGMLLAAGDDVVKLLTLDSNEGSLENGTSIH